MGRLRRRFRLQSPKAGSQTIRIEIQMKNIASILTLGLSALCAQADTEEKATPVYELSPVVVRGELWQSELAETTASVTVLDVERLAHSSHEHFEDLIPLVPNLTATGGTARPRFLQIRGIGENSQFEGETPDSSVRFLVDDLDFTGLGGVAGLFDVRQVEVLRGPQAGAFGANASGGMVRVSTNEPTPYWTGRITAGAGTDALREGGLAVGGPLLRDNPEDLTFRFAAHRHVSNGFIDNEFLGEDDTNERDELMTRLQLRWSGTPDWQWDGTLFYADQDNGFDEFSLSNSDFETFSDEPGRDEQESLAGSLKGVRQGDSVRFTTLTTATHADSRYAFDADWTDRSDPRTFNGFVDTDREREIYSQELRLDSIAEEDALGWLDRWTVGLYFRALNEDTVVDNGDDFGTLDAVSDYEARNLALFAQGAHHFSERTRLTLGLRAEHAEVEADSESVGGGFYTGFTREGDSDESELLLGGKLALEHDLTPDHMIFASAARGYRAAGANVASFVPVDQALTYDDESLWNFETGLRNHFLDGRLRTRLTLFYLYRDDTQLRDSAGSGGLFTFFTDNGESAKHYGLESEATWRINRDWTAGATLGLLETEREGFEGLPGDRELSNSPPYSFSARIAYDPGRGFFANAGVSGRGAFFESNSHDEERDAFTTVNAAVGYRWGGWTFRIWGRNIFDEEYADRVFFFSNERDTSTPEPDDFAPPRRFEALADPAQFGASLSYAW